MTRRRQRCKSPRRCEKWRPTRWSITRALEEAGIAAAMLASDAVYDCRKELAELFEAKPEDIVFTMNATHALNLAIKTLGFAGR